MTEGLEGLPSTSKEALRLGATNYFTGQPCKHGHIDARNAKTKRCLTCLRLKIALYRSKNEARFKAYEKARYAANLNANRERVAAYRAANIESLRAKNATYRRALRAADPEAERSYARKYRRRRAGVDPFFVMRRILNNRLRNALKGVSKASTTMGLLGCTREQLMAHLESQFLPGMTWDNRGQWQIDHIIPCASFDLTDPEQQRACFHYSNLRPLWAEENRRKGAGGFEPLRRGGGHQLTLLVA
jgi:hypothetical protein